MPDKRLHLVLPTGFCGGVRRALDLFRQLAASVEARPLYVLHELVHNSEVTEDMRQAGARFVNSLDDIPHGAHVFFGAHGVSRSAITTAQERGLEIHDATCPLVARIQAFAASEAPSLPLIFLGDGEHPEVQGILGHAGNRQIFLISGLDEIPSLPPLTEAIFLCQTTKDTHLVAEVLQALRRSVLHLHDASHICESVLARQEAVRRLAECCDLLLIIGSRHSANAKTLLQAASGGKAKAQIIEAAVELSPAHLDNVHDLGLASATSTPDSLVSSIINWLGHNGFKPATS